MKNELFLAKKILKDPNLSKLASRKFNNYIDKINENLMFNKAANITDILPINSDVDDEFEVELTHNNKQNIVSGNHIKFNS